MFFLPIRHCGSAYSKPRVLPILSSASFWCTSRRRSKNKISPRLLRSRSSPSKFVSPSTRSLVCANEIGSRGEPLRCSPQNNVYEKSLLCFHVGCSWTCSAEADHVDSGTELVLYERYLCRVGKIILIYFSTR